jgi:CDP-diacylglycerol--glycerol-3-phosphate 3-phosphatidyltransferase
LIFNVKHFIAAIILIKILTLILGYIKYKKLGFLHTFGNKISGIVIFFGFCIYVVSKSQFIINIGIIVSIISSLEELLITIIGKYYRNNIKGIWEINKINE